MTCCDNLRLFNRSDQNAAGKSVCRPPISFKYQRLRNLAIKMWNPPQDFGESYWWRRGMQVYVGRGSSSGSELPDGESLWSPAGTAARFPLVETLASTANEWKTRFGHLSPISGLWDADACGVSIVDYSLWREKPVRSLHLQGRGNLRWLLILSIRIGINLMPVHAMDRHHRHRQRRRLTEQSPDQRKLQPSLYNMNIYKSIFAYILHSRTQ